MALGSHREKAITDMETTAAAAAVTKAANLGPPKPPVWSANALPRARREHSRGGELSRRRGLRAVVGSTPGGVHLQQSFSSKLALHA